jgi:hypothetical protein
MLGRGLSLIAVAGLMAGCTHAQDALVGRYGPYPVPSAAGVVEAASRQIAVVQAISQASGFDPFPLRGDRASWYNVILTGFNVVDDACTTYIDDLWILERRKSRNSTIIAATAAAVAGIISAGKNPSAEALAVLAQAFGLASALNTAIADSYLYTQSASTVQKLVRKTTDAYRDDLASHINFSEMDFPIASPAAAYYHMREYLALCLPPSIQAQIEDLVAKAKAAPEGSARAQNLEVQRERALAAPTVAASRGMRPRRTTPRIIVQ